jgi:peptidoglycan/LPS O-acetylase OafA/YrhL
MIYVPYTASVLLMIYNVYMVGPPLWRRAGITKMVCDAGRMSLLWYLIHVPVVVVLNGSIHWGGGIVSFVPGFLMVVGITAALISIICTDTVIG